MTKIGQLWRLVRESHARPLAGAPSKPSQVSPSETSITFIGHSSFLIQTAGQALLIDPVFATRLIVLRRQRRPGLRIADLPPIDAVLLTHAHMDHLNRPSLRAMTRAMRRRGLSAPVVVVPKGVEDLVQDLGFSRIETLEWWQSLQLAGLRKPERHRTHSIEIGRQSSLAAQTASATITVTATPARHWGARMFNDTHRGYGGYVIEAGGQSIYHSGDTAYFPGFAEIGKRLRPQGALLPIGAYFPDSYRAVHTSPEEAIRGFMELGAEWMVPMHYGTFRLGREPMDEPVERLTTESVRLGISNRVRVLEEGETLRVGASKTATVRLELNAQQQGI